jgi:hypothetical protein
VRRRFLLGALLALCSAGRLLAADAGLETRAAAYLNFSLGARAIGMGQAQAAVPPRDASVMHTNPANLPLLRSQTLTTSSGALGLDRSLYFAGYSFPFRIRTTNDDMDFDTNFSDNGGPERTYHEVNIKASKTADDDSDTAVLNSPEDDSAFGQMEENAHKERHWRRALEPTTQKISAVAVGMTSFGISDIEGRSEFGAQEASFKDTERDISLSFASQVYENLSLGATAKYLGQSLQGASAKGFGFDVGTWYGVPFVSTGKLNLAFVVRDLGAQLKWHVPDPNLDTEFSYKEKVATKFVFGTAYSTPGDRWLLALDLIKASQEKIRPYAGLECRIFRQFRLRGGFASSNPSFGFGYEWHPGPIDLAIDYAFQYDLNSLVDPQWFTLSLRFLPIR